MSTEEARKIARQHLGDTLTTLMRGGPHGDDWVVYAFACGTEASAHAPTVDAAAADCAAQLRAAGWNPSHARLEWEPYADGFRLVLRLEGVSAPLWWMMDHDGWFANTCDNVNPEGGDYETRPLAEIVRIIAEWCATNLPSLHLPPFPETPHA